MTGAPNWVNPVNDLKSPYTEKLVKRFFYCALFLLLTFLLLTIFTIRLYIISDKFQSYPS